MAVDGSSRCKWHRRHHLSSLFITLHISNSIFYSVKQCFACPCTRSAGDVRVQLLCCKYMHANELKMVVPDVFLPARGLLHSVSCFSCIYWPCRKRQTKYTGQAEACLSACSRSHPRLPTWHFLQLQFVITAHPVSFPLVVV